MERKGTFISSVFGSPVEEYYLGKNTWSGNASDWKQRFEVGDVVADPAGDWDPSTAETYIDQQIATVTGDLASETLARQAGDAEAVKVVTQSLTTSQKDIANANLENKDATNGMARIELKAIDNFKQVVEAQTDGNTIFVIKYDYTLTGNVDVPANCVLEFDGGSISARGNNDTITGNNTQIVAYDYQIFNNVLFGGSFDVESTNIKWFGAKSSNEDNTSYINAAIKFALGYAKGKVYIPCETFDVKGELLLSKSVVNTDNIKGFIFQGVRTNVTRDCVSCLNFIGSSARLRLNMIPVSSTLSGVHIYDIQFSSDGSNNGLVIDHSQTGSIERCLFYGFSKAIFITGDSHMNKIDSCTFYGNNVGIYVAKSGDDGFISGEVNNNWVFNCGFFVNTNPIIINDGAEWTIRNCNFETENGTVILSSKNRLENTRFESSVINGTWIKLSGNNNTIKDISFHYSNGHAGDTLIEVNGSYNKISYITSSFSVKYICYDLGEYNCFDIVNYSYGNFVFDKTAIIKINGIENKFGTIQKPTCITSRTQSSYSDTGNVYTYELFGIEAKDYMEYNNAYTVNTSSDLRYITTFVHLKNYIDSDVAGFLLNGDDGSFYDYPCIKREDANNGRWVYLIIVTGLQSSVRLQQQDNAHPGVKALPVYINISNGAPSFWCFDNSRCANIVNSNSDGCTINIMDKDNLIGFSKGVNPISGTLRFVCKNKTYICSGVGSNMTLIEET